MRKIRNEASSCLEVFFSTLRFYNVARSPGSPHPHLLDGHRKLVGCSAVPARSCPGPVRYPWVSIMGLEAPPNKTPGLMRLHPQSANVFQCGWLWSSFPPRWHSRNKFGVTLIHKQANKKEIEQNTQTQVRTMMLMAFITTLGEMM